MYCLAPKTYSDTYQNIHSFIPFKKPFQRSFTVSLISTVSKNKLLCLKNSRSQWFSPQINNRRPWQLKKIKIFGAVLEIPAKQHGQSSPFTTKMGRMGQLAGRSKTAPRILICSTAMGAKPSFQLKYIAT